MTENKDAEKIYVGVDMGGSEDEPCAIMQSLKELMEYRAIGTIEEFKGLKEKSNKDFELLLKSVKESYPMFKGAYVELDVFMGDVMRRFARDRKET